MQTRPLQETSNAHRSLTGHDRKASGQIPHEKRCRTRIPKPYKPRWDEPCLCIDGNPGPTIPYSPGPSWLGWDPLLLHPGEGPNLVNLNLSAGQTQKHFVLESTADRAEVRQ